jgi:hypothetical protein
VRRHAQFASCCTAARSLDQEKQASAVGSNAGVAVCRPERACGARPSGRSQIVVRRRSLRGLLGRTDCVRALGLQRVAAAFAAVEVLAGVLGHCFPRLRAA